MAFVSVVMELFFPTHSDATTPTAPDPGQCNDKVSALLTDLQTQFTAVQTAAAKQPKQQLAKDWQAFSKDWNNRWQQTDEECGFTQLADTGKGPAFDRVAWVHHSLPTIHLKYSALLKRFTQEQSEQLRQMTAALAKSKELLQQKEQQ